MANLIQWLNTNQGTIMAMLTVVYVVTTAVIAFIGYRANKLSRRHLDVAIELDRRRTRPYVIFDIVSKLGWTHAVLKNVGLSTAYDVKVSITPKLTSAIGGGDRACGLTTHTIRFLPPSREITDFLDQSHAFLKHYEIPTFEGSVEYSDDDNVRRSERFMIDLSFHRDIVYVIPNGTADEVANIGDTSGEIAGETNN